MVGCARTGSTLLRHVLNRSPYVSIASETHYMAWARRTRLIDRLEEVRGVADRDAALRRLARRFLQPDFWIWLRRNVTAEELADRLGRTDLSERAVFATFLELYGERRGGLAPGKGIVGEKTPAHLRDVPRLSAWFPDARFIHTFRDPRGIYASELRALRQGRWGPKARLPWVPARLIDTLLPSFEAVGTLSSWHDASRLHRRYERLLGQRYRLVRFEDLVTDPENEVRAICAFIGIEYDASLLEGVDVVGSSFADEKHGAAGFDPAAAERWREEIHPMARSWFAIALGRRLARFGYRP